MSRRPTALAPTITNNSTSVKTVRKNLYKMQRDGQSLSDDLYEYYVLYINEYLVRNLN